MKALFRPSLAALLAGFAAMAIPAAEARPPLPEAAGFDNAPSVTRGAARRPSSNWSVAEDRRRAKKSRNVKRNRKAHRGARS